MLLLILSIFIIILMIVIKLIYADDQLLYFSQINISLRKKIITPLKHILIEFQYTFLRRNL